MRRQKTKLLTISVILVIIFLIHFLGVSDHIHEVKYDSSFNYPLAINIMPLALAVIAEQKPAVDPINNYSHQYLSESRHKCKWSEQDLVILVKSAMEHFDQRAAIRKTWGSENQLDVYNIKTVFFLGIKGEYSERLQKKIDKESEDHKDIVQSNFIDSYFNNTLKTIMAFRWAYEHCPMSKFYLFSDDDMFVSVRNAIKFTGAPEVYPESRVTGQAKTEIKRSLNKDMYYVDELKDTGRHDTPYSANYSGIFQPLYKDLAEKRKLTPENGILYAGFVFISSPHRHLSSKWHVPLEEYPWDMWPPYVTAGAYILSQQTLKLMYAGSLFVKHFRFDDIYLGIVANKLRIEPLHCDYFYFYKKPYTRETYKDVIASHGYHNPEELIKVWSEMMKQR